MAVGVLQSKSLLGCSKAMEFTTTICCQSQGRKTWWGTRFSEVPIKLRQSHNKTLWPMNPSVRKVDWPKRGWFGAHGYTWICPKHGQFLCRGAMEFPMSVYCALYEYQGVGHDVHIYAVHTWPLWQILSACFFYCSSPDWLPCAPYPFASLISAIYGAQKADTKPNLRAFTTLDRYKITY